jgi:DNA modification methylase
MSSKSTLFQGDCLELMKDISAGSIDMVLTDPPYGTTACKWDSVIPFEPMWEQLKRITKSNGAIVLTASQPFTSSLVVSNFSMFRYDWTWKKNKSTGFLNANKMPLRNKEDILVFYKKPPTYNPQKTFGHKPVNSFTKNTSDGDTLGKTQLGLKGGGSTERFPTCVQEFAVVNQDGSSSEGKHHPTQKPVALMEYLIKTYTNEGDTVLDFTMGSGTTGVACKNLNRDFIGIELDPEYFKIAQDRIAQA